MPGHYGARPPPFYRGYSAEDIKCLKSLPYGGCKDGSCVNPSAHVVSTVCRSINMALSVFVGTCCCRESVEVGPGGVSQAAWTPPWRRPVYVFYVLHVKIHLCLQIMAWLLGTWVVKVGHILHGAFVYVPITDPQTDPKTGSYGTCGSFTPGGCCPGFPIEHEQTRLPNCRSTKLSGFSFRAPGWF